MAKITINFVWLFALLPFFALGFLSHALEYETNIINQVNFLDIPNDLIVAVFLDRDCLEHEKELTANGFRKFVRFIENEHYYPLMPFVSKRLLTLFKTHGMSKTDFGIRMAPKKSPSEQAIDLSTILAAAGQKKPPKKEYHACNSVVFASPYALTLVLLLMNVAHQALFGSYFAEGAWAYGETAVAALAVILSALGASAAYDNAYSCCGRRVKGSRCGIFYGMSFHVLLGVGNFLNVVFSCLSKDCSTGAYLPITAPTAGICLAVLLCGSPELFCPDAPCPSCQDCSC